MAREQLEEARELIRAKRYEDARALLITIDHPTADKWLDRLNSMTAARSAPMGPVADYATKAIVLIVLYFLLFIPGLIAGHIWSTDAKQAIRSGQPQRGAQLIIRIHNWVITGMVTSFVVTCCFLCGAAISLQ